MKKRSWLSGADLLDKLFAVYAWGWHRVSRALRPEQPRRRPLRLSVEPLEARLTPTAPVAVDDTYSILHDHTLTVNATAGVLANDSVSDSTPFTAVFDGGPSSGSLSLNPDGSFTYTPPAGVVGNESFTYHDDDSTDGTDSASATVTIQVTDHAPIAVGQSFSVLHDQTLVVSQAAGLLSKDSDPDGDTLTVSGPTRTADYGTVRVNPDGSFIYTPPSGFVGSDWFQYSVSDGALTSYAYVALNVTDQAPVLVPHSYTILHDHSLTVSAADGVLAGASDADGDTLTASGPTATADGGTVTLSSNGAFSYTPPSGFAGPDYFVASVSDGAITSLVSVALNVTDHAPVPLPHSYSILHDHSLTVSAADGVLAGASDADGDTLTASGPTATADGGTVTLSSNGAFSYTPPSGFAGPDYFLASVSDGAITSQVSVALNVTDTPPTVLAHSYSTPASTTLNVSAASGVLAGASDADGDTLTASGPTDTAAGGTVAVSSNGAFSYTPPTGFSGTDYFLANVSDGAETTDVYIALVVGAGSGLAGDQQYSVAQGQTLTVSAAAGLLHGSSSATAALTLPAYLGSASVNSDGSFSYTPPTWFTGTDSFVYAATSGGTTTYGTVAVAVTDSLPVVADESLSVPHGQTLTVSAAHGLLAGASAGLTAARVSGPYWGSATVNSDGSFSYTPATWFSGVDTFVVGVTDGALTRDISVVIDVTDTPPVAADQSYSVLHDQTLTVSAANGLLAGASSGLTAARVSGPFWGSATINSDGSFSYTPATWFSGSDSFVVAASDGALTTYASVVIDVTDQAPVAADLDYAVAAGNTLTVGAGAGLLASASDADGDALTASTAIGPYEGSATISSDGSFTYTPPTWFSGSDSFLYGVADGALTTYATATVQVAGQGVAAAPDAYTVAHDHTLTVSATDGLLANDTDVGSGTLTVTAVNGSSAAVGSALTLPSGGTVTVASNGALTFVPESAWGYTDTFQYTVSDGTSSAVGTVTIQVTDAAPVAVDASGFSTNENTALTIAASSLLSLDSDADGDPLNITDYSQPPNGTLTYTGGTFTYTPNTDYYGGDSFTYTINDGAGASASATVSLTVTHVLQPPIVSNQWADTPPNTAVSVPVLDNATDPDGDSLTVSAVGSASHGTVSIDSGSLSVTYTPDTSYVGLDSFTYTADNGYGNTATATVTVDVGKGQWANSVLAATSQWTDDGPYDWYAVQALGVPNTLNDTDVPTAWAPEAENGTVEQLTLGFPTPDYANGVLIRETDGNGFVTQVELLDTSNVYHTVWSGTDPTAAGSPASFVITFTTTTYEVKGVRITVDTDHDPNNWEEIDAVRLLDSSATDPSSSAPTITHAIATATVNENGSVNINVSSLATESSGDPFLISIDNEPSNGTVTINDNGTPNDPSDDYLTYTPDQYTRGTDSFTYTVTDIYGNSSSGTVDVTITPVYSPPDAEPSTAVTDQGSAVSINPLANDSDPDNDPLTISAVGSPAHGSVTINSDYTLTYTPSSGFSGSDTFTYTADNGHGGTGTGTVTVLVYPTGEWASAVLDVTSQYDPGDGSGDWGALQALGPPDTFAYGDAATAWAAANADDGTGAPPEQLTVGFATPAPATGVIVRETNGNGFVTEIEAQDTSGTWHTLWTTSTSQPDPSQQGAPTDLTLSFPVTSYDVQAVRISVDSNFDVGDWEEIDAVRLLTGGSPTSVTLNAVTIDEATASDAWVETDVGTAVSVPVLDYASDANGATLTVSIASGPSDGSATVSGSNIVYTPSSGYSGIDTLTYEVTDPDGASTTATLHFTVDNGQWATSVVAYSSEADDGPYGTAAYALGRPDTTTYGDTSASWTPDPNSTNTSETLTLGIASAAYADGVLIRESSGNGFVTQIELEDTSNTWHTVWSGTDNTAAGNVADFVVGFTTTSYEVNAVRLTVDPTTGDGDPVGIDAVKVLTTTAPPTAPAAPTAANDSVTTAENAPVNIDVLAGDTLTSGSPILMQITSAPSNGTAAVDLHGLVNDASQAFITYWPNADFSGTDTLTYQLTDLYGHTTSATVSITITAVNQPPTAGYTAGYTNENTAVTLNVLANASDPDGDTLTVTGATAWAHGTVTVNSDYTITYTPTSGYTGSDTFTYTVDDGHGHTDLGYASVIVYEAGEWASTVVATSSERDTANAALGVPDDNAWTPDGTTALDFLTVGFATPAYGHGVLVREEGGAGAVSEVDLIDTSGTSHMIWSGTDPTASSDGTPVDFVLNFATTSYQVAAVRVFVTGGGTLDAVELLTSGSASSTTVTGRGFDDSGNYDVTVYNSAGQATNIATYVAGSLYQTTANTYDGTDTYIADAKVTDANGNVTDTTYDASGDVLTQTLAYGTADAATTTNTYDSRGDLLTVTDPDGNETVYTYDEGGRELTETDPLGNTATRTYNALGQLASVTNRNGQEVIYSYDSEGRETGETSVADALQTIILQPTTIGGTWTLTFGGDTTSALAYDASAATVQVALEALGSIGSGNVSVTGSATTQYTVMFQGTLADTNVSALTADGSSLVIEGGDVTVAEVTAGGTGVQEVQTLTLPGTVVGGWWAPGGVTAVAWDASAAAVQTALEADLGVSVTVSGSYGTAFTVTWDADGAQDLLTPTGIALELSDGWISVRTEQQGAGTGVLDTLNYTYNAAGEVATAGNDQGTYTYTYNDQGQVIAVSEPFGVSLTFGYDANGNRDLVKDSFGDEEDSLYNSSNQLVERVLIEGSVVMRLDFTYTAAGQIATISRYSDLAGTTLIATTTYSYDDQGNVTAIVSKDASGTTIDEFDYVYDLAGNLTSETDNGTTTSYSYDAQNEVTGAGSASYAYDANGNPANTGDAVGTNNELTTDGTWNYYYDLEGNETEKINIATGETWTYTYDAKNELTVAKDWTADPGLGGTLVEEVDYKYDVYGNRDEMDVTSGGTTTVTRFAQDGWNPAKTDPTGNEDWDVWADLNGSNALQTLYLHGDVVDQIFGRIDTGTGSTLSPYWLLTDHLGSVRTVLDGTGAVKDRITYDAFGNITSESDAAYGGRYKWTGREFDVETGLQYNRARYYDPTIGRWISQDPMGFDAGDSNLYRYARNETESRTDPSGLQGTGNFLIHPYYKGSLIPYTGIQGQFFWPYTWSIFPGTKTGGWIIQKITMKYEIQNAAGTDITGRYGARTDTKVFLEAWKIPGRAWWSLNFWSSHYDTANQSGKEIARRTDLAKNELNIFAASLTGSGFGNDPMTRSLSGITPETLAEIAKADDWYQQPLPFLAPGTNGPTSGKITITGQAMFVETKKNLPPGFIPNNPATNAGTVLSMTLQDAGMQNQQLFNNWLKPFMQDKKVSEAGGAHNLTATWTVKDPRTKLITNPNWWDKKPPP